MRGGNTSVYGSALSFVILFPVAIFLLAIWLFHFIVGFIEVAYEHFSEGADYYVKD